MLEIISLRYLPLAPFRCFEMRMADDLAVNREARASADQFANNRQVSILAFVDGVGFESNRAGLDAV